MPENDKTGNRQDPKGTSAEVDEDFDDMLAELRAADLTAPAVVSNNSSSSSGMTVAATATAPTPADFTSATSSANKALGFLEDMIPEDRIAAILRGDLSQLRRWAREGLRVTSSQPLCQLSRLAGQARCRKLLGQRARR
jgi:hypothetical protein